MATEKEEIILDFKVEQGDVITGLENLKKVIVQNKQEQQELNKAFRTGKITAEEYAKESVRVENALKRQQKQYGDTQKAVLGHKSKIDELIKSNQNLAKTNQGLSKSFEQAAGNINIAGTNVGSLSTKIASLANPVTAAVAGISALSSLYAASTIGAKDLEFAQNRLSAAFNLTSNAFANFISSGEDGQGIISQFVDGILDRYVPAVSVLSELLAQNIEELEDLGRKELEIREGINDVLGENQELMTQLQDDQLSYNDKIGLTNRIITNIRDNEEKLKDVLEDELELLEFRLTLDRKNEGLQTQVLQKRLEISRVGKDADKKAEAIRRIEVNLLDVETKRLNILRERQAFIDKNEKKFLQGNKLEDATGIAEDASGIKPKEKKTLTLAQQAAIERDEMFARAQLNIQKNKNDAQKKSEELYTRFITQQQSIRYNAVAGVFGQLSQLSADQSEEQKTFGLLQIALSTGVGVAEAVKAGAGLVFPANLVAIATGVSTVLAGIAQAKSLLGFAEGGWTGPGDKYKPAGVVHADEYVTPKHIVHAPAAQPHLMALERMRLGNYYDGGLVARSSTNEANQQLALINAWKSMPAPIVGVKEFTKVQNAVKVKEQISNR